MGNLSFLLKVEKLLQNTRDLVKKNAEKSLKINSDHVRSGEKVKKRPVFGVNPSKHLFEGVLETFMRNIFLDNT